MPPPQPPARQTPSIDAVRIDVWLWAVRLCKSRAAATTACRGGHVKVNSRSAKAATLVRAGDRVEARLADRDRVVEVVRLIDKRVGAPLAAACLVDLSPPPLRRQLDAAAPRRDRGTGRPTKKDRRRLDRFRGR